MSEFATVPGALKYLELLGSSAAIADEFERRRMRSKVGCPESCAVADFLTETVGVYSVTVDGDEAFGFYNADVAGVDPIPTHPYRHELPQSVHEFVVDFDCGKYPNLVSSPSPLWAHADGSLWDLIDLEDVA